MAFAAGRSKKIKLKYDKIKLDDRLNNSDEKTHTHTRPTDILLPGSCSCSTEPCARMVGCAHPGKLFGRPRLSRCNDGSGLSSAFIFPVIIVSDRPVQVRVDRLVGSAEHTLFHSGLLPPGPIVNYRYWN